MEIIEWNLKCYEEKDSHADCICINISFSLLSSGQNFILHIVNTKCENSVCCHYHTFIVSVANWKGCCLDWFLLLFSSNYVLVIQHSCHCL